MGQQIVYMDDAATTFEKPVVLAGASPVHEHGEGKHGPEG